MSNVGKLTVDLALRSAQFDAGIKKAVADTSKAAASISSAMGIAKAGVIGFMGAFSVDMLMNAVQQAFDYGDAIVDLADKTGATTKTIQEFRYAAQMSGSSMESADAALEKFAKNLGAAQNGNKAMAKTFKDLGINIKDNTEVAFRDAMDGISKLGSVTQRNQKTIELFGKSAGDLTVLMGEGADGFNTLAGAAERYGIVIDDQVLRNGAKVNDQLDAMKMILNAQMANMIIQNADALMQLANGFMTAAAAAVKFFTAMSVSRDMSLQSSNPLDWDIPSIAIGKAQGKSNLQVRDEARDRLKQTPQGRSSLYTDITTRYNAEIRKGTDKNLPWMQAMRVEAEDMAKVHHAGLPSLAPRPETVTAPPASGGGSNRSRGGSAKTLKSDEEIEREYMRTYLSARSELYGAQADLSSDPSERADLETKAMRNRYFNNLSDITDNTGSEQEVKEGKKRYTKAKADELALIEKEIFDAQYDRVMRDRDEEIAEQRLAMNEAGLRNDADMMSAEMALARSSHDRRDLSLRMVENQFAMEKLQLDAIVASKTATAAEKKIAEERLKLIPVLKGMAQEEAKRQTQSPLEAYLDAIPKTANEINDALESVEVEGLQSLQDGLMGIIKGTQSVGEAFSNMTNTVLDGLMKIALQKAIIEPIGNALFGGDSGGGLFGALVKRLSGKRANGGFTAPGDYLVGERGPEIARIGTNATVIPTHEMMRGASNDNRSGGLTVEIGSITSNDPDAIERAVFKGIAQATPLIAQQASDKTMTRLRRRTI